MEDPNVKALHVPLEWKKPWKPTIGKRPYGREDQDISKRYPFIIKNECTTLATYYCFWCN